MEFKEPVFLLGGKKEQFKRSCYYEWQFWEMAWTMQDWQQEVYV